MIRRAGLARSIAATALTLALATGAGAESFRIGVGAPLSGADAVFGSQVRLGVEQAVADTNAASGFLGRKGEVSARDDGNDPKKGVEVAKAFVAARLPLVVGHVSSAVTVPTSAIYAEAGTLDITPSAFAPIVTERGLPDVFRTCGREDEQAGVAARFLLARHVTRIAIVHDRTPTGKDLADAVRKQLAQAGVRDVFYGSVEKGTHDVAALAARIKSSNAQIVFWGGGAPEAGMLVKQMRDAGGKALIMGGVAMASDDFGTLAGSAAEGSLIVFPQDPHTRPAAADLLRRLKARGLEPDGMVFYAYAAVQVVRQAADAAGSLEPAKLAATMHDGRIFHTVVGDFGFDAKGDRTVSDYTVYVWHKGATGHMAFDEQARS